MQQLPSFILENVGRLLMVPESLNRFRAVDLHVRNTRTNAEIHLPVLAEPNAKGRYVSDRVSFNALDTMASLLDSSLEGCAGRISVFLHQYRESDIKRSHYGYMGILPDIRPATENDDRRVVPVSPVENGISRITDRMTYILRNEHIELCSPLLYSLSDELWENLKLKNQSYISWAELSSSILNGITYLPFDYPRELLTLNSECIPQEVLDAFSAYVTKSM